MNTTPDERTSADIKELNAQPLLAVKGLEKTFGQDKVLNDINFAMASGEVVAVVGPSGSGKSTLLRCINNLEQPTEGTITVGDVTVDAAKTPFKKDLVQLQKSLGMVFQTFNLFPHLTVLENVSLAQRRVLQRSRKDADDRSMQLLTRVGLPEKANVYPASCSGGQQQRIAISRALALDPQIMLFDEPTSAIDPEVGLEVLSVMRELANDGMTMIVVTHEMRFAEDVSDRVVVMAEGEIIEAGCSTDVMRNPTHPRAKQFLTAVRDR